MYVPLVESEEDCGLGASKRDLKNDYILAVWMRHSIVVLPNARAGLSRILIPFQQTIFGHYDTECGTANGTFLSIQTESGRRCFSMFPELLALQGLAGKLQFDGLMAVKKRNAVNCLSIFVFPGLCGILSGYVSPLGCASN